MTAAMAVIAGSGAVVYGREHIPELAASSVENIRAGNSTLLSENRVVISAKDGCSWDGIRLYNAIHCGAAAEVILFGCIILLCVGMFQSHCHPKFWRVGCRL